MTTLETRLLTHFNYILANLADSRKKGQLASKTIEAVENSHINMPKLTLAARKVQATAFPITNEFWLNQ
jgi:hypothetical protein